MAADSLIVSDCKCQQLESEILDLIRISSLKPGQENALVSLVMEVRRERKNYVSISNSRITAREREVVVKEKQANKLKEEMEAERAEMIRLHERELKAMEEGHSQRRSSEMEKARLEHDNRVQKLSSDHAEHERVLVAQLKDEFERRLVKLRAGISDIVKKSLANSEQEVKERYNVAVSNWGVEKQVLEDDVKRGVDKVAALEELRDTDRREMEKMRDENQALKARLAKLKEQIDQSWRANDAMASQHQLQVDALRVKYDENIEALKKWQTEEMKLVDIKVKAAMEKKMQLIHTLQEERMQWEARAVQAEKMLISLDQSIDCGSGRGAIATVLQPPNE